jgi:uncharacterized membrane protein
MYHWWFLWQLKQKRIVAAIRAAELRSSGEIRVFVSHKRCPDAMAEARLQFAKLNMQKTELRNGVLIFLAPRSQSFAILGDEGVHQRCGIAFWEAAAEQLSNALKAGHLTSGIVAAVEACADQLALHFPRSKEDRNELPDDVIIG